MRAESVYIRISPKFFAKESNYYNKGLADRPQQARFLAAPPELFYTSKLKSTAGVFNIWRRLVVLLGR